MDLAVVMVTFFKIGTFTLIPHWRGYKRTGRSASRVILREQDFPCFYPDILPALENKSALYSRLCITIQASLSPLGEVSWATSFPWVWWEALGSKISPAYIQVAIISEGTMGGAQWSRAGSPTVSANGICPTQCKIEKAEPLVLKSRWKKAVSFLPRSFHQPWYFKFVIWCCTVLGTGIFMGQMQILTDTWKGAPCWLSPHGFVVVLAFSMSVPSSIHWAGRRRSWQPRTQSSRKCDPAWAKGPSFWHIHCPIGLDLQNTNSEIKLLTQYSDCRPLKSKHSPLLSTKPYVTPVANCLGSQPACSSVREEGLPCEDSSLAGRSGQGGFNMTAGWH